MCCCWSRRRRPQKGHGRERWRSLVRVCVRMEIMGLIRCGTFGGVGSRLPSTSKVCWGFSIVAWPDDIFNAPEFDTNF